MDHPLTVIGLVFVGPVLLGALLEPSIHEAAPGVTFIAAMIGLAVVMTGSR